MNNNGEEKLCDLLIGEAVLALLQEKAGISRRALLAKLQFMLEAEQDEERAHATKLAIQDVMSEIAESDSPKVGDREQMANFDIDKYGNDDSTRH
ncbi:hypothetical protein [Pantoea sp. CTOTU46764]|uniref:hypothetical protein n=1 Tax=Pantoea sp. CTOTU46764 TaxID=2953854 RepID=UPI0028A07AD0|nr:hypothetical protein [Pantoea sp. CTOTU46764]